MSDRDQRNRPLEHPPFSVINQLVLRMAALSLHDASDLSIMPPNMKAQVCRRLLSVDDANKICERADNAVALRDRSLAGKNPPGPSASPAEDSTSLQSPSSSSITAPAGDQSTQAAGRPLSHGLRRSTIIESNLNDLLGGLFQEADTKGKVNWAYFFTMEPFAVYPPEYTY